MNASERKVVTVFSKNVTTDQSAVTATSYTGRQFRNADPPWLLYVTTANIGTAPSGTISIICKVQESTDGSTWTDVKGFANTAIAAAGAQSARVEHAGKIGPWLRVVSTHSAGTWAAGTTITAYLAFNGV